MTRIKKPVVLLLLCLVFFSGFKQRKLSNYIGTIPGTGPWPSLKKEMRPWTRWWWMANAVDEKNIGRLLHTYSQAGFGGVEITPIYGAVGYEKRYIDFLSPEWMDMLSFTVGKAAALRMGVDMNTGTGWPFGGPQIKPEYAASKLIVEKYSLKAGEKLQEKVIVTDAKQLAAGSILQALTAYGDRGERISLLDKVDKNGNLMWSPARGVWEMIAVFAGKTLQKVKRAAPGGEGLVLNHLSKASVDAYLHRFDTAFRGNLPEIRSFFNDSYEVNGANFSPNLFDEFKKRRGYDLRLYLEELISDDSSETVARVKSDYRETMSDMLLHNFTMNWTDWAHSHKKITKNQAHGSPGNLLDLYGAVDIPECEAFFGVSYFPIPRLRRDSSDIKNPSSNPMIFKFASSAAHNYGKPLVSSETFVWLTEHFKTALSQCKPEVERLFLGGVNHVFYHGTTYSPDDVAFPGWLFYASTEFEPSNSLWPHLKGLNNYIARCQSVLQAGQPDNELLLYWPVYDCWSNAKGMEMQLSMHNVNEWLSPTSFNNTAKYLQNTGYSLDFASDKMIATSQVDHGDIEIAPKAPKHKTLIIPACKYMPLETLEKIIELATAGATIIFQQLPVDVPGLHKLEERRRMLNMIISKLSLNDIGNGVAQCKMGNGEILVSDSIQNALEHVSIYPEQMTERNLKFIRRDLSDGKYYYIVNHSSHGVDGFIPLNTNASSITILDPQSGDYGMATITTANDKTKVRIQMEPGEALILRTFNGNHPQRHHWRYIEKQGSPIALNGPWLLHFTNGGPELPSDQHLDSLFSWTRLPDKNAIAFSGSGIYTTNFTIPEKMSNEYLLQLGRVYESAHVWINGKDVGILWSIPFKARVGKYVKPGKNEMKIEVANLMANRIRDMDKKGIEWRKYHEINFVNIDYKPFDASEWAPMASGLLGPVTIVPVE